MTTPEPAEGLPVLRLINALLRTSGRLVRWAVAGAVLAALVTVLRAPRYTAVAVLSPQSSGSASRLSGIAAQFGFTLPAAGDAARTPQFYASLVVTPGIAGAAVTRTYAVPESNRLFGLLREPARQATLVQLWDIDEGSPALDSAMAVQMLTDQLTAAVELETSTLTLRITTPWPTVSAGIVRTLLEAIDGFDVGIRQSQAAAERGFVARRLIEASDSLETAEAALQRFLERNRDFRNSAQLQFEQERLRRRVDLQLGVVTGLAQGLEQARIDEVRNTPVTTVVRAPVEPVRGDARRVVLMILLGGVLGGSLAATLAVGKVAAVWVTRGDDPDASEFRALVGQMGERLAGIPELVRRRLPRRWRRD